MHSSSFASSIRPKNYRGDKTKVAVYRDKTKDRWIFDFKKRIDGVQHRVKKTLPKGWSKAQAEKFNIEEEARLFGIATGIIKEAPLISDAILFYLKQSTELKTYKSLVGEFQLLESFYENRRLDELDAVCAEYTEYAKANNLTPRTIQARISYLCTACRKAWKHKKGFYDKDPTVHVIKPVVKNDRHYYLTRKQVLQLARATPDKMVRRAILIAFYTGMRLDEICRAQIINAHFVLITSKNDEPRSLPIHPKIAYISRNPRSFNRNRIQNTVKVAKKKVGLEDFHFHDLRHSAASAMVQNKVDVFWVAAVLGHKDMRSTKRYAHLATQNLAEAISAISINKN
jgi:integrase